MGTSAVLPMCVPSGVCILSIRVAAEQAQSLQCDVVSCAVYDCFLRQNLGLLLSKNKMCGAINGGGH
jgi:hypothetical protein